MPPLADSALWELVKHLKQWLINLRRAGRARKRESIEALRAVIIAARATRVYLRRLAANGQQDHAEEARLASLWTELGFVLADLGLEAPGLNRMIAGAYDLLGLQTFFTTGPKEVRAWTVRKGASAYDAAGEIHTDFQRGFIRAEVIDYETFVARGGEQGAKAAGQMRLEGRDYVVFGQGLDIGRRRRHAVA